jgi:U3 small nucleolar RNA-associated protein 7
MGKKPSSNHKRPRKQSKAAKDDAPAKPLVATDGGTLNIARGPTAAQVQTEQKVLQEQLAKYPAAAQHLTNEAGDERIKHLQKDDATPNPKYLESLNDKQRRSLEHRRKRPHKATAASLERLETKRLQAALQAAQATEILETTDAGLVEAETDMERTTALTQTQLKRHHLDAETARHSFQLDLEATAPYGMKYDRSGRYSILYGQSGHLALMDNHQQTLQSEFHVQERVRDACFLHNFTMFAAAQKNHAFIYDDKGVEIHRLGDHTDPMALEFLPYHWLLASIGRAGWLKYQDTSTGQLVSSHRTQLGSCSVLRQNPMNAVLAAGHSGGTVTLWSPANSRYLAKIHCHKGAAVHSLAFHPDGRTLVTGGADRQIRVWDLRMYKERFSYLSVAGVPSSLDISQQGVLAVGHAGHATFWPATALERKVKDPYMRHAIPRSSPVETVRFRPFEDVCGIGHARGVDSVVIPGTAAAQLDTTEYHLNPMADIKQRREAEVRALLDKLSPNMITLNTAMVGGIEESNPHAQSERVRDLQERANAKGGPHKKKNKTKKRGQSKIATQLRRKRKNVIDDNTLKLRQAREEEETAEKGEEKAPSQQESAPAALKRFF